jgi:hypothetical protein
MNLLGPWHTYKAWRDMGYSRRGALKQTWWIWKW